MRKVLDLMMHHRHLVLIVEERDIGPGTVLLQNNAEIVMAKDILPKIVRKESNVIAVEVLDIYLENARRIRKIRIKETTIIHEAIMDVLENKMHTYLKRRTLSAL